jgi:ribokinase
MVKNMHVLVVGSLNMDLVVRMPQIPHPGETLLGGVFKTFPGGKGANQAVAAARLGARVTLVGCVGSDAFGREMRDMLSSEGIDNSHVRVHPDLATGVALIQVDDQGQNSIAVASGANFQLTRGDVERAIQSIDDFDVLVMPLETPMETVHIAAQMASQRGSRVLLNPAPAQVLDRSLLELVDVLLPNEYEAAVMTGLQPLKSDAHTRSAAEKLLAFGAKSLIITRGSQGATLFEQDTESNISAFPVHVVDTTAAGDCFVGALAVALCDGRPLASAAEFASAAAAISVTREGAQPSLPRREEVTEFMHQRSTSK